MARQKSKILMEAEQRIMRVLWEKGEASVREVTEALKDSHGAAYTTVLTQLRILTEKGYVIPRQEGRAFIYRPLVSRSEARSQALKQLLGQFFEGSPEALAQHLMKDTDLSIDELAAIRQRIEDADGEEPK
ncbi:MAG: MarR family transcriptional regulator [Maricaulis sp.]|jgi:predicted transcriptional regulator|nr:MarR family transcriptional regulator [Maricaulis sp.]HAQ34613.1 MarR family transcriptional regulator [Alphaproteobacteria bacterium]|tara:strand:+ start:179 stop:571 length:393 start_codon:yes stop_codon:yes gene_type:complete